MKDIKKMLKSYWGTSYEKELTENEISAMIRFDWEMTRSIPDASRYKVEFLKKTQEKYLSLGVVEEYEKFLAKEQEIREKYPLIHGERNE